MNIEGQGQGPLVTVTKDTNKDSKNASKNNLVVSSKII